MDLPSSLRCARLSGRWASSRDQAMRLAHRHRATAADRDFYVREARYANRMAILMIQLARSGHATEVTDGTA